MSSGINDSSAVLCPCVDHFVERHFINSTHWLVPLVQVKVTCFVFQFFFLPQSIFSHATSLLLFPFCPQKLPLIDSFLPCFYRVSVNAYWSGPHFYCWLCLGCLMSTASTEENDSIFLTWPWNGKGPPYLHSWGFWLWQSLTCSEDLLGDIAQHKHHCYPKPQLVLLPSEVPHPEGGPAPYNSASILPTCPRPCESSP